MHKSPYPLINVRIDNENWIISFLLGFQFGNRSGRVHRALRTLGCTCVWWFSCRQIGSCVSDRRKESAGSLSCRQVYDRLSWGYTALPAHPVLSGYGLESSHDGLDATIRNSVYRKHHLWLTVSLSGRGVDLLIWMDYILSGFIQMYHMHVIGFKLREVRL